MKKNLLLLSIFLFSISICLAQRANRAGVLAYAYDDKGEAYFLLGAEVKKGNQCIWSEFNGVQESEVDFPRQTAARVFTNETRCFFGLEREAKNAKNKPKKPTVNICKKGLDYILPRLQGNQIIALTNAYSVYVAQIDWVAADQFNRAPKIYEDGKLLIGANKKKFIWVSIKELMAELKKTKNRNRAKLPLKYRTNCGLSLSPETYDLLTHSQTKEFILAILKAAPKKTELPQAVI
jgi:hypothetical protein